MNPYKNQLTPDFETNAQLPEWMPMGGTETPNMSPFIDALKKRMMKPPDTGGMGAMMGKEVKPSGGMKSL